MNLRLPRYDDHGLTGFEEPLQPAPRKVDKASAGTVAGSLPRIACSPRVVRAFNWVPPTVQPNTKVAVYGFTPDGGKSDVVEPGRVVAYLAEERKVLVRLLHSTERRVVPMSWVLDWSLGGTERHPWKPRGLGAATPSATSSGTLASVGEATALQAPEVAGIAGLRSALVQRYGSVFDAWEAIDVGSEGCVGVEAFARACRDLRYGGDLAEAFADLASVGGAPSEGGALLATLRHFKRWMAEHDSGTSEVSQVLTSISRSAPTSGCRASSSTSQDVDGAQGVRRFRMALLRHFDTLPAAWRELDTNRDGVMQFREFCAICRRVDFKGNLRRIWQTLVEGEPEVELEEDEQVARPEKLDPRLPEQLRRSQGGHGQSTHSRRRAAGCASTDSTCDEDAMSGWDPPPKEVRRSSLMVPSDAKTFRDSMVKKFGSLVLAWGQLAPEGCGSLTYQDFVAACSRVDFQGNFRRIFADLAGGGESFSPADLDPALPFALRLSDSARGPLERQPSHATQVGGARASVMDFDSPGPKFHATRRRSASTMREVHSALLAGDAKEGPPSDATAFRSAIIKKFGSYASAWEVLDAKGSGRLSYRDFVAACRAISFAGNFKLIFEELAGGEEVIVPGDLHGSLECSVAKSRTEPPPRASLTWMAPNTARDPRWSRRSG